MDLVDSAEKEASEVLHSLLSVERIEKPVHHDIIQDHWHSVDQHFTGLWQEHTVQLEQPDHYSQQTDTGLADQAILIEEIGHGKPPTAKKRRKPVVASITSDPTVLEDNAQQVRQRFDKGCDCQEENCFKGLGPEYVYRHRLNIAELTKAEHDMYLMGVTMAVLTNPEETVRRKERRRLRAQYVFQGRRVCLDAFLYLENCTHYQLKRIRKHVMTHGVAPRVHGNHGKKPHNTFPLDIYTQATDFLRSFIDKNTPQLNSPHLHAALVKHKPVKFNHRNAPLYLPADVTRKTIHNAYKNYCESSEPVLKVMGYSTFRHFMKEQFSNVKFCKIESNGKGSHNGASENEVSQKMQLHGALVHMDEGTDNSTIMTDAGEMQQVTAIPVVLSSDCSLQSQEQTTYIVTPVSQMGGDNQAFAQYQLTPAPANYTVHQGTITMSNTQPGTYAFTTL